MNSNLQAAAERACAQIGVVFRQVPIDGRFHQLDVIGKVKRNGAGRIRNFTDGEGGQVWNHITDETQFFWAKCDTSLTPAELEERKRRALLERERSERELAIARQKAATLAKRIVDRTKTPVNPLYWQRKQVAPTDTIGEIDLETLVKMIGYLPKVKGKAFSGNMVQVIPVRDDTGITSVEMIDETGLKAGLSYGKKKGCFWASCKLPETDSSSHTFLIGEGVATVLSSITAMPGCIGIAALSSGNLVAVSGYIRNSYQQSKIIILSDIGNGEQAAVEAARSVNALLFKPSLPEDSTGSDVNDVHCEQGIEEARRQIEAAILLAAKTSQQTTVSAHHGETWPQPVLFGEVSTPEIPASILPDWLGMYTEAVAANTQTPPAMSVMMGLATIAACVQKRFQVARTPEHIEPLALWTVTALPPASRKTAVVNAFTGPIAVWEKDQFELGKGERSRVAVVRSVLEDRVKVLQTKAAKTDNASDRNSWIEEAARLQEEMPELLHAPRVFTADVTPERLQDLMMEQQERMGLFADEGGIFSVMAGLYSGGKANIDIFLKGHAGSAVRVDRQGRMAYLDEPALTFGLCIQPDIIRSLSETSFRGNGCLARFLFCLPTSNIGTRTASSIPIPQPVKTAYQDGIRALLNIPPLLNELGKEQARTLTLDTGAMQAWNAFFTFMESNMGEGKELEPIQDWAGKLAGAALRIAGLMAVVEQGEAARIISEAIMTKALKLCELLIGHAKAAFDLIDGGDSQNDAKHVFRWILEKGALTFKRRDAQQELTRFREVERLEKAFAALAKRYIVSEPEKIKSASGKGMPSIVYHVNPAIFDR
jgi:putative DNA primase/helicase